MAVECLGKGSEVKVRVTDTPAGEDVVDAVLSASRTLVAGEESGRVHFLSLEGCSKCQLALTPPKTIEIR